MAGYGGESGGDTPSETGFGVSRSNNLVGGGQSSSQEVLSISQRVDNSLVEVFTASTTKAKAALPAARSIDIKNVGDSVLGVVMKFTNWSDANTLDTTYSTIKLNFIIPKGQSLKFPSARVVATDEATFLAGTAVSNTAPDSNMYVDSTADTDNTTATDNIVGDIDDTTVYLEPYTDAATCTANLFHVGDLIRVDAEIMEVTAIGDKSDLANNTLTVIRGVHGSTAVDDHADDEAVRLPFFNAYHNYNKFSTARTDKDGKFRSTNFFGYGRATNYKTSGLLAGSIAFKCYSRAYQELGMSGITASTHSGLAASTEYKLNITIDGGSTFANLAFTTDATNLNFGGRNGIVPKIQAALNTQYYTAGNLFEKRVYVEMINGDIRFTSGSRLSTSAVALAAPSSGATPFGVGRITAIGSIESAVASRLPDDTITNPVTQESVSNASAFMWDDGNGGLVGKGRGSINYETGAMNFTTYPDTEFVLSVVYGSAMTGKLNADAKNVVEEIKVQSLNAKVQGKVSLSIGG